MEYSLTTPDQVPNTSAWTYLVKLRDHFTCQECGATEELQAHHINTDSGKQFLISNGITVCRNCHNSAHYQDGNPYGLRPPVLKWIEFDRTTVYPIKQDLKECAVGGTLGIMKLVKEDVAVIRSKLHTTRESPISIKSTQELDETYTVYITRLKEK